MASTKKTEDGGHIIDVTRKAAPSATSKPVIVTNRPILKDPMMVDSDDSQSTDSTPPKTAPALKPLEASKPDAGVETKEVEAPTEPEVAIVKHEVVLQPTSEAETKPEDEAKPNDAKPEETPPAPGEPKPGDGVEEPEAADKQGLTNAEAAIQAQADKQAAHDEAVQKLVDSKQYYLSINSVEKKRSREFVLIGILISLLLAIAWADVALDAGLIKLGNVKPVTHFFSN